MCSFPSVIVVSSGINFCQVFDFRQLTGETPYSTEFSFHVNFHMSDGTLLFVKYKFSAKWKIQINFFLSNFQRNALCCLIETKKLKL